MSNVRTWLSGGQVHFYCNLKLGLLKLQERAGTSHVDIDQDDVSQMFVCRCWAIIHGLPIRQRPVDAVFAPVQIGFYSRLNVCRVSLG